MSVASSLLIAVGLVGMISIPSSAQKPIVITYIPSDLPGSPRGFIEQDIVNSFNQSHPGVRVVEAGVNGSHIDKIKSMMAAGQAFDVGSFNARDADLMYNNQMLNLTPYIQASKLDLSIFRPGTLGVGRINDQYYGLPHGAGGIDMYINVDLFNDAGIPVPGESWTLDDIQKDLPKLSKRNADGTFSQWALGMNSYPNGWAPFFLADGGEYINSSGQFALSDPVVTSRMDWLAGLVRNNMGVLWKWSPWSNGKMAMKADFEGRVAAHLQQGIQNKFQWRLTYMPQGKAGPMTVWTVHFRAIFKSTQHPNEAWQFLEYMYTHGDALFGENFDYPTTINGARALLDMGSSVLPPGYVPEVFYRPVIDPPPHSYLIPQQLPGFKDAYAMIQTALKSVQDGSKSAVQAMSEIRDPVNSILRSAREKAVLYK